MVEVTQARELATALISVERFDADGNFHPDYLAMLDKYRQAGVQQGLDMERHAEQRCPNCHVKFQRIKNIDAEIRNLGGGDA